jgi:hypothetical protein
MYRKSAVKKTVAQSRSKSLKVAQSRSKLLKVAQSRSKLLKKRGETTVTVLSKFEII